ncbi:purine nucleotide synthesis repressor [Salmonella enterica subsp. enterica serovar Goldcoast]|nr:purine nucleotide synthesis repressor [Salmonella enterica subsp. enterica serovar Goldcoast]
MATIKDVAKRANVSTTTVSHVINKTRFVAEETRNAVWAAIKELHYSPSAVARSLKVNHTKSIGLLATSSEAAYFAEIIEAVEKNCFQKGYTLILGNAWNNLEKQRAYLSMMAQKRVDGLLVMCSEYPEPLLSMLEEYRHIPMVVMDWGEAKADFTDTVIDNAFAGGYMAGRYLVERGHRDIGVIPGPLERNTGAGRLAGFMKAMGGGADQRAGQLDCSGRLRAGIRLPRDAANLIAVTSPYRRFLRRRYYGDGRALRG